MEVWHDKCLPGSLRVARPGELARKILDIVADDQVTTKDTDFMPAVPLKSFLLEEDHFPWDCFVGKQQGLREKGLRAGAKSN